MMIAKEYSTNQGINMLSPAVNVDQSEIDKIRNSIIKPKIKNPRNPK